MACLSAVTSFRKFRRLVVASCVALGLGLSAGCVNTENWLHSAKRAPVAAGPAISECAMIWAGLNITQDSVNGGQPLPGIAGRMYLIGPDRGTPVIAEGKVVVDMYVPAEGGSRLIERWEVDAQTLKRLARKDSIGDGYTLFLPWASYNPELTQAQMRLAFHPKSGANPIYASPAMLNLRPQGPIPIETRQVTR